MKQQNFYKDVTLSDASAKPFVLLKPRTYLH